MNVRVETFQEIVARFVDADDQAEIVTLEASLAAVHEGAADPLDLVSYLRSLAVPTRELKDLLLINEVPDEEEVSAHLVAEGIALTTASDGAWVLFRE